MKMYRLLFAIIFLVTLYPVELLWKSLEPQLPKLDYNAWWGPDKSRYMQDTTIRPFWINFNESMINDLRIRLHNHRPFVPPLEGIGFQYGFNTKTLEFWVQYWAQEYPFAEREKYLNQFPQYKTNIQGLDIHFIWIRPQLSIHDNKAVVPLLLLHGWPSSVLDFYLAIPLLTTISEDRDFALELIVPSLPGYGYSDPAVRPGLGVVESAVIFRNLMHRLGHKKFYIHGGDMGGLICTNMATLFPEEVLGYHTNFGIVYHPKALIIKSLMAIYPYLFMDPRLVHRLYPLTKTIQNLIEESGYFHIQATKPDTQGVGLTDSPAALLAYILEKFSTATNAKYKELEDGGLTRRFTREELVDNLMLYWSSNCITTSMRMYAEMTSKRQLSLKLFKIPTQVPTWVIQAENEIVYQPPVVLRVKFSNLVNVTVLKDGGHFLAWELPHVFSNDLLEAIKTFRSLQKAKVEL